MTTTTKRPDARTRIYNKLAEEGGGTWATYMMMDIDEAFATPVAQEPVAYQYRACIAGKWGDWTDLHQSVEGFRNGPWKFGLENGTCELRALYAGTPPATPAGVGADEIAQIIATKCFDPRVTTTEERG